MTKKPTFYSQRAPLGKKKPHLKRYLDGTTEVVLPGAERASPATATPKGAKPGAIVERKAGGKA